MYLLVENMFNGIAEISRESIENDAYNFDIR